MAGKVHGLEAYNLANGVGFSVLQVIDACRRVTGQPIQYSMEGRRAGDPATLVGECAKALSTLGWTPRHARLEEIIATAWSWMESHADPAAVG
jgi:UDP-glucose 4-epimerase